MTENRPDTVAGLLDRWARDHPDRTAHLVAGGGELTFGDWARRGEAAAAALRAHGAGPGTRVGLSFPRQHFLDFAVCLTAVHRLGAVAVLLPAEDSARSLAPLVETCRPDLLLAPEPADLGVPVLAVADLPGEPAEAVADAADPGALATVIFTSGTTGTPKAVGLLGADVTQNTVVPEDVGGTLLHSFPLSVPVGQWATLAPLFRGLRGVMLPEFDPRTFLSLVDTHDVTETAVVPALVSALRGVAARPAATQLRQVTVGSARCPVPALRALREIFPRARIVVDYASTESGSAGTSVEFDDAFEPEMVGHPRPGSAVRVVGADGRERPPGEEGTVELMLPPGLPPRWYVGDPDATAATFLGRWVRMADLGRLDEDGRLHLTGRTTEFVNLSGRKVSCQAVERVFEEHPAVREAAAFAVGDPVLGEELAVAVVTDPAVTTGELRGHAATSLAAHQVPGIIEVCAELPRTRTGKVRKEELARRLAAGGSVASAPAAGGSVAGGSVAAVFRAAVGRVLGQEAAASDRSLTELGASSVQVIRIYRKVVDGLGVEFDLGLLLTDEPRATVADRIAAAVRQAA